MKKILFYETGSPVGDRGVGGSFVSLLQIVQTINKNSYKPVVVLFDKVDIVDSYIKHGCKVLYIKNPRNATNSKKPGMVYNFLHSIPKPKWTSEVLRILRSFSKITELTGIIKKENINIVHCNGNIVETIEGVISSFLCLKPCVCHNRGYLNKISFPFKFFANKAAVHISISESINEDLKKSGIKEEKIVLIHNWINLKENNPVQLDTLEFSRREKFLIVSVGRIIPKKGQHLLIEAAKVLKAKKVDFSIHIFGDATSKDSQEYFQLLKSMIKENNLESHVFLIGYRPYQEIYTHKFHLAVHTSITPEPFGRVIIEAMYNHIPVIASGKGGVLDIIQDGKNGLLFDPEIENDLINKIVAMIESNESRMELGREGYRTVLKDFSEAGKKEKIESIYDQLCS